MKRKFKVTINMTFNVDENNLLLCLERFKRVSNTYEKPIFDVSIKDLSSFDFYKPLF